MHTSSLATSDASSRAPLSTTCGTACRHSSSALTSCAKSPRLALGAPAASTRCCCMNVPASLASTRPMFASRPPSSSTGRLSAEPADDAAASANASSKTSERGGPDAVALVACGRSAASPKDTLRCRAVSDMPDPRARRMRVRELCRVRESCQREDLLDKSSTRKRQMTCQGRANSERGPSTRGGCPEAWARRR